MPQPVHILWADDYHLGDPLFAQSLARALAQVPAGQLRVIIVHGGGERAEHALEGRGRTPARVDGVLKTESANDREIVERAIREANKTLTSVLTEFSVPAIGIQGSDRGLLKVAIDGSLALGRISWLQALIVTGSVPVVSALGAADDGAVEVRVGRSLEQFARAFGPEECIVVAFTRSDRPGIFDGGHQKPTTSLEVLAESGLQADMETVGGLAKTGFEVRFTSARHAISSDLGHYTRISLDKSG